MVSDRRMCWRPCSHPEGLSSQVSLSDRGQEGVPGVRTGQAVFTVSSASLQLFANQGLPEPEGSSL